MLVRKSIASAAVHFINFAKVIIIQFDFYYRELEEKLERERKERELAALLEEKRLEDDK